MGMAASQVRFLSLQNRKNTIGLNLMTLSNRKTALSRDMSRVANEYNNAMNQKTLKWSNDSGVTYSDLTYDKLMKPNELNTTKPYIITDAQGRVVLDDSISPLEDGANSEVTYRDLAMMISSYSGHDTSTGKATYNNLGNLNGGTGLSSKAIRDISDKNSIADKAVSGSANTDNEYKIVTSSQNMVTNSLRYEIMSKLGLISAAEKTEIINKEMELYGSANNDKGPYPVGSLMGDYYLAKANLAAYEELVRDGSFNFSVAGKNAGTFTSDYASIDGTSEINYKNTTGTTNSITFNGASSYLKNVDLKQQYDANSGTTTQITNSKSGIIQGNFSYTINDGKITYANTVGNLLDLASTSSLNNEKLRNNGYTTDHVASCAQYKYWTNNDQNQKDVQGESWKSLYNKNATVFLEERNGGTGIHEDTISKNLNAYIKSFASDFKTGIEAAGLNVDDTALNNATISTYNLFWGNILGWGTNSSKSDDNEIGWRNAPTSKDDDYNKLGVMNTAATGAALDHNLFGWATSDSGKDHNKVLLSVKNMINSFVSFYDFYAQSGRTDAITKYDDIQNMIAEDIKQSPEINNPSLSPSTVENLSLNGVAYIVKTYKDTDGTYQREYYLKNPSTGAEGALTQIDMYNSTDPDDKFFQRITYKADGVTEDKYYQATDVSKLDDIINNTKNTLGAQSGISEFTPSGNSSGGSVTSSNPHGGKNSNNSLTLTFESALDSSVNDKKGDNTHKKEIKISQSVADSNYSDYVSLSFSSQYLNDLQKKVDEAAVAKDAALKELDTLFAEKDAKIMDYFDALFNMISQNGWVYDENVNNQDKQEESKNYLNAKLQNNMYFITEVETLDGKDFNYATKLATNVSKVFQVYDTDAQNTALSKYESEKADINAKEKQIDIRMNKLETEQDAIKTELDSIKSIIKDNVDSTFKIFT